MNEIDPTANSNGVGNSDNYQQASSSSSANKSPLLSSLLTSSKPEAVSNGQQNKVGQLGMMPTPAISSTPNYDESNAFMTKLTTENSESVSELDLSATNNSQKKLNNLNDILQRNNNNNKTKTVESTAKSILENCLLKPSPHKTQRLESQIYSNMEEGEYHHPSTSSVLKFGHPVDDHRKVEPLKINLNREPIRTVIKLPQSHPYESPSKIAIKTPQLHQERAPVTISPTLSSSSSLSSESSFENCSDNGNNQRASSIQVIPKLHIRNALEGSLNHEQSELHIVPKLTITGLNSPQSTINRAESPVQQQQTLKDHSVNSILETSPTIPKLTIKKDNNTSDYHLNNDVNSIPKIHIKTNHQTKDMKVSIKTSSEPLVPKLTIKTTTENDAMIVSASDNAGEQQTTIPKFTIKSNLQSTPKLTIKPVVRPAEEQEESIPKLTLKAVNNSEAFEKIVPKLVVKLPKEPSEEELESTSYSSTPSPPPIPKLSIRPIPSQDKEVPKLSKSGVDSTALSEMKFSMNRLIGAADTTADVTDDYEPLEINTTSTRSTDSGQDSPRIILKINKSNSESITSEIVPQLTTENAHKSSLNHKRVYSSNDNSESTAKKPKLNHRVEETKEDVILINDSDTSSSDVLSKNQQSASKTNSEEKLQKQTDASSNTSGVLQRSLRQSRRKAVLSTPAALDKVKVPREDTLPAAELDPLASNDTSMNSNSHVEDLVTPKRGRGRPKKVVEKVQVDEEETKDPLEGPVEEPQGTEVSEENSETKKISGRGRGRGRGRSKRTVEVMKNGKPIQITLEGHDDDDSPSFSLYNRTLKATFGSSIRKGRGGKVGRGKGFRSSFVTPDRSKDGIFTSPLEQNSRRKILNTPSLFEEDTRMSIGCDSSQATPVRYSELHSTEESQSSLLSSASNTVDGSVKKRQKKIDASEAEG